MAKTTVTITVGLEPEEAAGLCRLCEKLSYEDAQRVLYPHVARDIRDLQVSHILSAAYAVAKALGDAKAGDTWPWIDTGRTGKRMPTVQRRADS